MYFQLELILPEEIFEIVQSDLIYKNTKPTYMRVIMPLKALLEGVFFDEYIKKGKIGLWFPIGMSVDELAGNILMLSEGRPGVDKVYSLREGAIRVFNWGIWINKFA